MFRFNLVENCEVAHFNPLELILQLVGDVLKQKLDVFLLQQLLQLDEEASLHAGLHCLVANLLPVVVTHFQLQASFLPLEEHSNLQAFGFDYHYGVADQ